MGVRVVFSAPRRRRPISQELTGWTWPERSDADKPKLTRGMTPLLRKVRNSNLVQVDFEVWGDVQGFYFRKHTRDMCHNLGVCGWVKLTSWGTVVGQLQGEKEQVDQMAMWLRLQGAPGCKIERCDFKHWRMIDSYDFSCFQMRF